MVFLLHKKFCYNSLQSIQYADLELVAMYVASIEPRRASKLVRWLCALDNFT